MEDRELYARILGITDPWYVERVDLKLELGEVHIVLGHAPDQSWPCPECGASCTLHDHQPERQWRHLDTCQFKTILHAAPPRSNCPTHGPRVVKLPWAESGARFTALFEALAIHWLLATSKKEAGRLLGLSWDGIHHVMNRAVHREHAARAFFERWYSWAVRSRLKPMVEVARMLKKRVKNILTYIKLRITNARSEAINSKIQWIKYTARGYRNQANFITAIYFHCGDLNMAPSAT